MAAVKKRGPLIDRIEEVENDPQYHIKYFLNLIFIASPCKKADVKATMPSLSVSEVALPYSILAG